MIPFMSKYKLSNSGICQDGVGQGDGNKHTLVHLEYDFFVDSKHRTLSYNYPQYKHIHKL